MSSERYEIRGKIGQGGVGAVYQAFDTQLNREVAIKRVLAEGGYQDQEEATKHLLKEATALSSVQHPHIVTVYDAGIDDDGPYVVMELIHGRTLDEMVERGTLTWNDLREVALQTQEALIAAQDLDLVHRDLKPSNVMVCWLASGKFQVKIVDFGLAKFSSTPSLQTIDHGDAVFGSIFFMAPEQFERTPLDKRTDMYAMGCLYYYALTGVYPFNGDTAAAVMASHLQHHVEPLSEVRPDIPQWGADWIMWHIERHMEDRPVDARESLERFLILDKQSTQPVTVTATGSMTPTHEPNAPKFLFPRTIDPTDTDTPSVATTPLSATAPQPSAAPVPLQQTPMTEPVKPTAPVPPEPISLQAPEPEPTPAPVPEAEPEPALKLTTPQPISPPDSAISPHTKAQQLTTTPLSSTGPQPAVIAAESTPPVTPPVQVAPVQPTIIAQPEAVVLPVATPQASLTPVVATAVTAVAAPVQPEQPEQVEPVEVAQKKSMPKGAKWTIIGMLALVIAVAAFVLTDLNNSRQEAKDYTALMERAAKLESEGILDEGLDVSEKELTALLNKATSMDDNKKRVILRKCLAFAKGKGFDADPIIVKHITETRMTESIRSDLFQYVMTRRQKSSNITPLLNFAKTTSEIGSATQAVKAAQACTRGSHADEYISDFLDLINNAEAESVRVAAGKAAGELIGASENKEKFSSITIGFYDSAVDDSAKFALLRLLGTAGGDKASKVVNKALASDDPALQNAAISALGQWADDSEFENFTSFITDTDSDKLRKKAFAAAYSFLRLNRERDSADLADLWRAFSASAQSQPEKLQVIRGLANQKEKWAIALLEDLAKDTDDVIIDKAERAKERLQRRIRDK